MRQDWIISDLDLYKEFEEAFRGGNTHASRFYVAPEDCLPIITCNVNSYDRSSSYPDVMCNCKFPLGKWKKELGTFTGKFIERYKKMERAFIFRVKFYNIRLKDSKWPCPYISKDKCWNIRKLSQHGKKTAELGFKFQTDNGRILGANIIETTLTDIDYDIIADEYVWDRMEITDLYYCPYKPLPPEFIKLVQKYYKLKTELKNVPDKKFMYNEAKAKINALYGMSAQKSVRPELIYDSTAENLFIETEGNAESQLSQALRKAFLPYSIGVYVTAWARYWLERAIILIHETPDADFIYTDTDSVKFVGNVDFTSLNEEIRSKSISTGSFADDKNGKTHYMGVYEYEGTYTKFATMGAKKYIYGDDENIHVTISGVVKENQKGELVSAKELQSLGGYKAFKAGTVFVNAGGLEAIYNDNPEPHEIEIDGHTLEITRNVCLKPSTYTLGLAGEYDRLLKMVKIGIDNPYVL